MFVFFIKKGGNVQFRRPSGRRTHRNHPGNLRGFHNHANSCGSYCNHSSNLRGFYNNRHRLSRARVLALPEAAGRRQETGHAAGTAVGVVRLQVHAFAVAADCRVKAGHTAVPAVRVIEVDIRALPVAVDSTFPAGDRLCKEPGKKAEIVLKKSARCSTILP